MEGIDSYDDSYSVGDGGADPLDQPDDRMDTASEQTSEAPERPEPAAPSAKR